jgi:hypothetical protein
VANSKQPKAPRPGVLTGRDLLKLAGIWKGRRVTIVQTPLGRLVNVGPKRNSSKAASARKQRARSR